MVLLRLVFWVGTRKSASGSAAGKGGLRPRSFHRSLVVYLRNTFYFPCYVPEHNQYKASCGFRAAASAGFSPSRSITAR